ncbi:MAG: type II toxin-antitoxin system VapC family toxin [Brevundimonas sp.]|uniref:type II toxin-antitoxin system VapC family toxin n=1 Tax=Brevundimonas sp. TaxID=1871086 RepID=UPI00403387BD
MFYLDASLLVAAVTAEPRHAFAKDWLRQHQSELSISSWCLTEVASALSLKARTGQITPHDRSVAARQIELMRNTFLLSAPIEETHFFAATRFIGRTDKLRAGDALHLAIAADYGLEVVTLDRGMAESAATLSVDCMLL